MTPASNTTQTPLGLEEYVSLKGIARSLYKFRSPGERTENIIQNCELWFSDASEFNDPFDCQMLLETDATYAEVESFYLKQNLLSPSAIKLAATTAVHDPAKFHRITNDSFREFLNKQGVCCFAKNCRSTLMWSHYANSHKGLCLVFDSQYDPEFFTFPMTVDYQEEYQAYNPFRSGLGNFGIIKNTLLTKSKEWEYEQESRLLTNVKGAKKFKKEALKGIIFGANAQDKFIIRIKELAAKSGLAHLQFMKAEVSKTEYKLVFKPI